MSVPPRPSSAPPATTTVPVEVVSWVTKFVGGDGSGRRVFEEPLTPGATVGSLLRGLSARFPELHRALWNGEALGEHIEVLVNDAVLDIRHTLDSPLGRGDRIALLGQYMGGAAAAATSRQLPDQLRLRSLVQDPRIPGLPRPAGARGHVTGS